MRVLLIAPAISANLHVLSEVTDIAECTAYMPNLSLPTLAALTPPDVEVTLVDEAVESIDFDQQWDVVGITGYLNHRARMFEIADEFRRRGLLVAIGGPFVSLSPLTVRPHADVLFIGEAENTWPQFLEDFRRGTWKDEYRTVGAVDLHASPIPDIRRLKHREYYMGVVQTSRGCPFECEFCDVIVYLGRKQRHKTPERVVEELEQLYQAGYRRVFLSDDNFTAYRQKARAILGAVHEWTKDKPERLFFATQLSIDVARDTELLDLCATAGLRHVFIGIETPDEDALREVKKRQNIRPDLVVDVRTFHQHGIGVQAGMISGFDSDDLGSFVRQFRFVQEAGIPIVTAGILNAPEGTPLERRLRREGRLSENSASEIYLDTNIIPKLMTKDDLVLGVRWLLNRMYAPDAFIERLAVLARNLPEQDSESAEGVLLRNAMVLWQRILASYADLGFGFRSVPREAARLFRRKSVDILAANLVFYKHVVCVLRKWGVWDPELGRLPAAPFEGGLPAGGLSLAAGSST